MNKTYAGLIGIAVALGAACGPAGHRTSSAGFFTPADPPNARYVLDAKFDVADRIVTIAGSGSIVFKAPPSTSLSTFAVDWRIEDKSDLELSFGGKALKSTNAERGLPESTPLFYDLPAPAPPGTEVRLDVKFSRRYDVNSTSLLTFQKWYPSLWWEDVPTRDSFRVKVEPPPDYVMVTSGRLNESTGRYENEGVTTAFGVCLAKGMRLEQREVAGVLITALFTDEGQECGRLCLDTAADIIKFDKEWLGFYPFRSLTILPGASRPMGGYPFASAIVVIHGEQKFKDMPLLHWKWITAHEIGHQYWGEYVMSDDAPYNFTLSWVHIGLGICTDRKWTVSRGLGLDKHIAFLERYLDGVKEHDDTTVDAPPSLLKTQRFDLNNVVIHGKGFAILSALGTVIGQEEFERILKQALVEYGGRRMGWRDFWRLCERESGRNLDWFFGQWVRSNKYLCYQVESQDSRQENGRFVSDITVKSAPDSIRMPVPVEAVFEDGSKQIQATDRMTPTSVLQFESRAKLKEAVLDPAHNLAMLAEPLPVLPDEIPDKIAKLSWLGEGAEALKIYALPETQKITDVGLWLKLGMTLFDGAYYRESLAAFQKMAQLSQDKGIRFMALVWMGHDEDMLGERAKAIADYTEALKYDEGGSWRHDQYNMVINRQWVEERLKTPFKRPGK
jgi:hypothetical protein